MPRNASGYPPADGTTIPAGTVAARGRAGKGSGLTAGSAAWRRVKRFFRKAYEDNLTGLSAMVAYNLLLSLLPVTLLALFVAGRILQSDEVERNVLADLRDLFPDTAESTLTDLLRGLRDYSTSLGIAALVASVWIGTSFWGALDTAFCRIYHVRCRSWVEQKRFALTMLLVALVFILATVIVPTVQGLLTATAEELPFGLSDVPGLLFGVTLAVGLVLLFATLCVIYWAVPNCSVPWGAIWPGALLATIAIAIIDAAFPFYLSQISTIERVGTTLVFILIVLLWFYALAITILGGAVVNALRMRGGPASEAAAGLPSAPRASSSGSLACPARPALGSPPASRGASRRCVPSASSCDLSVFYPALPGTKTLPRPPYILSETVDTIMATAPGSGAVRARRASPAPIAECPHPQGGSAPRAPSVPRAAALQSSIRPRTARRASPTVVATCRRRRRQRLPRARPAS